MIHVYFIECARMITEEAARRLAHERQKQQEIMNAAKAKIEEAVAALRYANEEATRTARMEASAAQRAEDEAEQCGRNCTAFVRGLRR